MKAIPGPGNTEQTARGSSRISRIPAALLALLLAVSGCGDQQPVDATLEPALQGDPIITEKAPPPTPTNQSVTAVQPAEPADFVPASSASTNAEPGLTADGVPELVALPEELPVETGSTGTVFLSEADLSNLVKTLEKDEEGFLNVGFEALSAFAFEVDDEILNPSTNAPTDLTELTEAQIPKPIMKLNTQKVALRGFMLPLKVEGGLVTELLIMKDQSMCCFGTVPRINEWVSVIMVDEGVEPIMDEAITLYGQLNVGEMRENGYLVGIYSMDGEKLAGPLDE